MSDLLPFPEFLLEPVGDERPLEAPAPPLVEQTPSAAAIPDARARAQALDIQRSFIVEAPAGSGKTGLLIQRYLKLLADPQVEQPEQVLAITFTLKATAEMRDRVVTRLQAAHEETAKSPASQPTDQAEGHAAADETRGDFDRETRTLAAAVLERSRQLGWGLLEQPQRLNLRTIDSVCAEIARTLPVLSGSGGRLTPVEDAAPLFREAARRTLLLLGGGDAVFDAALRNLLLHRDGNLADCEALIANMLGVRDQWAKLLSFDEKTEDVSSGGDALERHLETQVRPQLERALEMALCATLGRLEAALPPGFLDDLARTAADFAHLEGYRGAASPIASCAGRAAAPEAIGEQVAHWQALTHLLLTKSNEWRQGFSSNHIFFCTEKLHRDLLRDLVDRVSHSEDLRNAIRLVKALPPSVYPEEQWAVAKSLFRVLRRALVELQHVFADRDQCDFVELGLLAGTALDAEGGADDLATALGARLQHLLVDEMQDTSTGQYRLIELLTQSWDGHSQTVFLVGDPRQSIYLFRQARVERFQRTLRTEKLGDLPLNRLRLTANFRSRQTLVEQFNRDFKAIFAGYGAVPDASSGSIPHGGSSSDAATPSYHEADAVLPPSQEGCGVCWHADPVENGNGYGSGTGERTAAQLRQRQSRRHAREIRRIVRGWMQKPLPAGRRRLRDDAGGEAPEPWRIAVLVRSRAHLTEIVAALKRESADGPAIPFRAVEIDPLAERQEVLDLTALTRALLHPADRVAWLAVLRAPWCGLSLSDLHLLTGADPETSPGASNLHHHSTARLIAERGHLLPEDSHRRLERAAHILAEARAQRARLPLAQLVRRAWRSLGGDGWLGAEELLNAHRFFVLLDELSAEVEVNGGTIAAVLDARLKRLFAEPRQYPATAACVDLLTIHKAKGLEWDVVIVPALELGTQPDRSRLLTWAEVDAGPAPDPEAWPPEHAVAPILLAPIGAKGDAGPSLPRWIRSLNFGREAGERKRLFYVACTRAREEVHLFAAPQLNAEGKLKPRWNSLLWSAWPAAEPHFAPSPLKELILPEGAEDVEELTDSAEISATVPKEVSGVVDLAAMGSAVTQGIHLVSQAPGGDAVPEASTAQLRPPIRRMPAAFDPAAQFREARAARLSYGSADARAESGPPAFARPEGSVAARAFGNAVHAFLELAAARLAEDADSARLLGELPGWTPRIATVLRAEGLPPATVKTLTRDALAALTATLRDPDGLWLLTPHPGATSEFALTAWPDIGAESGAGPGPSMRPSTVRVDRSFRAGPTPRSMGEDFLWIIDFKTGGQAREGREGFLAAQRALYAPQLEGYARVLSAAQRVPLAKIRLGLYYPLLPHLLWWEPGE